MSKSNIYEADFCKSFYDFEICLTTFRRFATRAFFQFKIWDGIKEPKIPSEKMNRN